MNKKRLIIPASLIMTVALIFTAPTVGYLTSTKTAVNHLGVATMVPDVHENNSSTPNSVNSVPQSNDPSVFPKEIRVQNTDVPNAVDAYVRVQLVPTLRDENVNLGGNFKMEKPKSNTVNGTNYPQSIAFIPFGDESKLKITLVFADSWETNANGHWKYRPADNCFYYTDIVKPGHFTEQPLLSKVMFSGSDADTYKTKFNLDVLTDSIQADGVDAASSSPAQTVWPVTISGTKLSVK